MVGKKPWLFLPASFAHQMSSWFLSAYGRLKPYQTLTWSPFTWRNLEFTNPLGIAGGVDKDAEHVKDWWTLGPGFIEIGTVTPKPQPGNSGRVLARDNDHQALWNQMGFPSRGVKKVLSNIRGLYEPRFTPIFANIGKNASTPLEKASEDYIECMQGLRGFVDAFVINVSSPNTEGLRDLLEPARLKEFLSPVLAANRDSTGKRSSDGGHPVLLKLSPEVSCSTLNQVLKVCVDLGVDGFVLTNSSLEIRESLSFPKTGGVSGRPLANRSKELLKETVRYLGDQAKDKLLISCGGVLTPEDVFERLSLGANLVQVYSALVFNGPFFFRQVADAADRTFKSEAS